MEFVTYYNGVFCIKETGEIFGEILDGDPNTIYFHLPEMIHHARDLETFKGAMHDVITFALLNNMQVILHHMEGPSKVHAALFGPFHNEEDIK